jgi:hypothetical protein
MIKKGVLSLNKEAGYPTAKLKLPAGNIPLAKFGEIAAAMQQFEKSGMVLDYNFWVRKGFESEVWVRFNPLHTDLADQLCNFHFALSRFGHFVIDVSGYKH